MKKTIILIMAIVLCFLLPACAEKTNIDFPFDRSSIDTLEMFHYTEPTDAEKKVINRPEDIKSIYELLESISLVDKATEPTAGGSVTSFRFNLSDGTFYEVVYSNSAVKSGKIKATALGKDYFTSADIEESWDNYDYEAVSVSESELPLCE